MLKEIREKKGFSQTELAEAIGVTFQAISNYELQKRTPPIPVFNAICEALKLSNKQRVELMRSFEKGD